MSDRQSKMRNLIIQEARKRRKQFLFPSGRINCAALERATGVDSGTINRILNLRPSKRPTSPEVEWSPKLSTLRGIGNWLNIPDELLEQTIWDMAAEADEADPPNPSKQVGSKERARRK